MRWRAFRLIRVRQLGRAGLGAIATAFLLLFPAQALGAADLSVSLAAEPTSLALGGSEMTTLTLAVSNAGPDPAEAVSGGSAIGAPQLSFFGFFSISQGSAIFNGSDNPPVTFNFGTIGPGATATLKWVENDANSGLATITANATTSTPDSNSANNADSAQVEVVGLVPSSASLLFGEQAIGGVGSPNTVTFTNDAAIPIEVGHMKLDGLDFVLAADGCSGTTLAAGGSCQVSSRFAPATEGALAGSLTAVSLTAGVSPVEVDLSGTGKAPPSVDSKPASLRLTRVPRSIDAKKFRKGFSIAVTPDEAAAFDVVLLGGARSGALASAFDLTLFSRSLPLASGQRTIRVKPKAKLLGPLRRKIKVQLKLTATDAAGNRSTATRRITVKPAPRR